GRHGRAEASPPTRYRGARGDRDQRTRRPQERPAPCRAPLGRIVSAAPPVTRPTQAAVLRAPNGRLEVEEIDIAEPGPGEVLVRIGGAGLCHTDLETMHGQQPCRLPAVLGHEGAGVVEAVGPGVTLSKLGDHVALSWSPNCGHCFYCDHGQPILCEVAARAN